MARPNAFLRRMRVVRRRDFARAFARGARSRGQVVSVVVVANELEYSRLGLSIGRAAWRDAVDRNRVRRVFREAFRLSYSELPRGVDVVLMPGSRRVKPALAEVRAELVSLVQRALSRAPRPERRAAPESPERRAARESPERRAARESKERRS